MVKICKSLLIISLLLVGCNPKTAFFNHSKFDKNTNIVASIDKDLGKLYDTSSKDLHKKGTLNIDELSNATASMKFFNKPDGKEYEYLVNGILDYQWLVRWPEALDLMNHMGIDFNDLAYVFVLDTGYHPNLSDSTRDEVGYNARLGNFTYGGKSIAPIDLHGHGTATGSIISSDAGNSKLINGMGANNVIIPVQVISTPEDNKSATTTLANAILLDGLMYTENRHRNGDIGATPVNMSIGNYVYNRSIQDFFDRNTKDEEKFAFVVAAGNAGKPDIDYPAGYGKLKRWDTPGSVISVGAYNTTDCDYGTKLHRSSFSNYNASRNLNNQWVHVAAPGTNITTLSPEISNKLAEKLKAAMDTNFTPEEIKMINEIYSNSPDSLMEDTGTSVAAPIVTAILTLAVKIAKHYGVQVGHNTLAKLLFQSAQYSPQTEYTHKIFNLGHRALDWTSFGYVDALGMIAATIVHCKPEAKDNVIEFFNEGKGRFKNNSFGHTPYLLKSQVLKPFVGRRSDL